MTATGVLDASPWTAFQIRSWCLIALTVLFDGVDQNLLAVTVPALSRQWDIDPRAFATVTALATFAMLIGSGVAGIINDRFGRRWTLIVSTLIYGLAGLAGAAAWDVTSMGVTRIVAGLGLGAALTTAVVSVAEHTPTRKRGVVIVVTMLGVPFGGILAGAMGALLIPVQGWQSVYLLGGGLPVLLALAYLIWLPETPAYLWLKQSDALGRYFAKMGVAVPNDLAPDTTLTTEPRGNPLALLGPDYRRNTLLLWAGFFSTLLASYHVIAWMPALMAQSGASDALASASLSYIGIGSLCAGIAAPFLVYYVGSRISMAGGAILTVVVALWLAFTFDMAPTGVGTLAVLPLVLVGVSVINGLFFAILPNVYPDNIRGVGIGIGMAMGRLGAVTSAYVGAWGLGGGGGRFFGVVAAAGLVALFAFTLITKHQPKGR